MLKRAFAEFFGTFILVLFACGTAAVTGCTAEANGAYLLTALAFGLVLCIMAYTIGSVSGCHINPAVSFGKFLCGAMSAWELFAYVVAQCLGALAGGGVLYLLLGRTSTLGANGLFEGDVFKSIAVEVILTALFVFAVLVVTEKKELSQNCPLIVGLALTLVHIFGIYFTGTSVNPARSLGPAVFVGGAALSNVWVFWIGPLFGAFAASLLYLGLVRGKSAAKKETEKKTEQKRAE
ncbi:MAG: MIP family channel protein [Clostridia bacterium]|nr:MIP family channel protein [Clostridia bacterium]